MFLPFFRVNNCIFTCGDYSCMVILYGFSILFGTNGKNSAAQQCTTPRSILGANVCGTQHFSAEKLPEGFCSSRSTNHTFFGSDIAVCSDFHSYAGTPVCGSDRYYYELRACPWLNLIEGTDFLPNDLNFCKHTCSCIITGLKLYIYIF